MIFRSSFKILRAILPFLENSGATRQLSYQHGPEPSKIPTPVTHQPYTQTTQRGQLPSNITPPTQSPLNCGRCRARLLTTTQQLDHGQKRAYTVAAARNSATVREKYKCDDAKPVKKLAFRQTTREECEECVNRPKYKDCKLIRPKRTYDPTKMIWYHPGCPKTVCPYYTPRLDEKLKPMGRKKLPPMCKPSDCIECRYVPMHAPPLVPPKKAYDPSKMKRDDKGCRGPQCNIEPERLDDIQCWTPTKKILPSFCA